LLRNRISPVDLGPALRRFVRAAECGPKSIVLEALSLPFKICMRRIRINIMTDTAAKRGVIITPETHEAASRRP
jgi:hypothetical protein